jgi:hypothetical protein
MSKTDKTIIKPHRFKQHEWLYIKTKEELISLLKEYQHDFLLNEWNLGDIRHFLDLYNYLYPESGPKQHHIRCIATITRGKLL